MSSLPAPFSTAPSTPAWRAWSVAGSPSWASPAPRRTAPRRAPSAARQVAVALQVAFFLFVGASLSRAQIMLVELDACVLMSGVALAGRELLRSPAGSAFARRLALRAQGLAAAALLSGVVAAGLWLLPYAGW